ncbi:ATP-binding protein [Anaerovibrio sp.]|uniref:ATP-binding protein n=1 Tax=Anaerovibrio sp. TaxID=1872532 RepID=UPI003F1659FD
MDKFIPSDHQLNNLYQKILDSAGVNIFWKDIDSRFMGANKAQLDFLGLTLDELIGHTVEELGAVNFQYPSLIDDAEILAGKTEKHVTGKLLDADGRPRDVIVSKSPLIMDDEVVGIIGTIEDITEKCIQRDIIGQLRETFFNVPSGICVYRWLVDSQDYQLIQANPAILDMLNLTEADIAGNSQPDSAIKACLHPEDAWQISYAMKKMQTGTPAITCNCRFYPKGERNFIWLQAKVKYVQHDADTALVYMTLTDINAEKRSEQALAESQRAYHEVAGGAGLVVWHYDIVNGVMEFLDNNVSRRVQQKHSLPQKLYGAPRSFEHHLAEESLEDFRRMNQSVRAGKSASCDVKFKQFPGQPPHWERIIYTLPRSSTADVPTDAYGVGMDITAAKLRQQQYDKELQMLHTAINTNLLSKCHFDLNDNKLLDYLANSPHALKLSTGMSYTASMEVLRELIISPEEQEMVSRELDMESLIHRYVTRDGDFSIEYRRHCDDLSPIMVECNISLFTGKTGHIECFVYFYDITNKFINYVISDKLTELGYINVSIVNNLTGTMTLFSKETGVIENTPDKPLFYDDELYRFILEVYPEKARAEELFGRMSLDCIVDQLDHMSMYDFSYDFRNPDGSECRRRLQAFYLDKTRTSVFIIQSDVTQQYLAERRHLEELEQAIMEADKANESKSIFLSGISHDMRTPLNGILSFTNFALNTTDEEKKTEYLHKIKHSGELLLSLINDTLNLTRIESGKVKVSREWISAKDMIDEIISSVSMAASERKILLEIRMDEELPRNIISDKLKLQEILLNLLSNAVKFTKPEGSIRFAIQLIATDDMTPDELAQIKSPNQKWVRIIVADTGIGMSAEFLPKLYDAFSQEESQEVQNPNGTGLGLSIVKKYIDMLGGTISVESQLGRGTTFELHILLEESLEAEENWHKDVKDFDFKHLHVLLVEDNLLNQEIATMLLQSKGATLDVASNGVEAVNTFENAPEGTYQLILMDIRMPVMNGYQATDKIRNSYHKDGAVIPIIAMTADAYDEDIRKCLEHGMNSHVSKPINPDKLYAEIANFC